MKTLSKRLAREEAGLAKEEYAFFASLLVVMVIAVYIIGKILINDAVQDGAQEVVNAQQNQDIQALSDRVEALEDKVGQGSTE